MKIKVIGIGEMGFLAVQRMDEQKTLNVDFTAFSSNQNLPKNTQEEIENSITADTQFVFIIAYGLDLEEEKFLSKMRDATQKRNILTIGMTMQCSENEPEEEIKVRSQSIAALEQNCTSVLILKSNGFIEAVQIFTSAVKSIVEFLETNTRINTDFRDVQNLLNKGKQILLLDTKEAIAQQNKNTALEICKKVFATEKQNEGNISKAKGVIINLIHGENVIVSMLEFEELQDFILEKLKEGMESEVIFGFGTNKKLGDKIQIGLMIVGEEVEIETFKKQRDVIWKQKNDIIVKQLFKKATALKKPENTTVEIYEKHILKEIRQLEKQKNIYIEETEYEKAAQFRDIITVYRGKLRDEYPKGYTKFKNNEN